MLARKTLFISAITLSVVAYSSVPGIAEQGAEEHLEARKVAQSVAESYMTTYDKHDPKGCFLFRTACFCRPTGHRCPQRVSFEHP